MRLRLVRFGEMDGAMVGALIDGDLRLRTIERPWRDNARNVSCIPAGTYTVSITPSARFRRDLFLIHDVPDRDGIRIHPANWADELEGCIAPGVSHRVLDGKLAVTQSRNAYDLLADHVGDDPWQLTVETALD